MGACPRLALRVALARRRHVVPRLRAWCLVRTKSGHGTDQVSTVSHNLRRWLLLGGVALGIRLIYAFETSGVPFVQTLVGDARSYDQWARRIVAGDLLGQEPFYQAPLYAYVLAGCYAVFGDSVWTIRICQAVWGAASCVLVALGGGALFGRRAGTIVGWLMALYAPAIFFDGIVQKASLDGFLVSLLLALLARTGRIRGTDGQHGGAAGGMPWRWFALGVVGGLLCLSRENAFVWLPVIAVWIGVSCCGTALERAWALAVFLLGSAIILTPVGARNYAVAGEWSFSTFQAGPNFYIGNHLGADGRYQPLVRGHETPEFERQDATRLAEAALERNLTPREVSRYWTRRTLEDIRSDFAAWLRLSAKKTWMVWNRYEVADVESMAVYREYSYVLVALEIVSHLGLLCPLAAVGIWATRAQWRALWVYYGLIATMTAAVALFYVLARYRFPLVPLLMPFAGLGLSEIANIVRQAIRRARIGSFLPALVIATVVAVPANWPAQDERRLNAMALANLGTVLGTRGELAGAVHYLERALEGHPQSAEIHFNLGFALSLQGHHRAAIDHYRSALRWEPTLIHADYLLGVSLETVGEGREAIDHYRKALEADPANGQAREALSRLERDGG